MLSMITVMAELDYLLFAQKEICEMLISVTGRAEDILRLARLLCRGILMHR